MTLTFRSPLANAKDFPAPEIFGVPTHIPADSAKFTWQPEDSLYINKARYGLLVLAQALPGERVWVPTYHCPALVEPFLIAGKKVCFYPLHDDLSANIEDLTPQIEQQDIVVGVRFFGFVNNLELLARTTRQRGAVFIEDLAHATLAEKIKGDYAVASLAKFYPVQTGGLLFIDSNAPHSEQVKRAYLNVPAGMGTALNKIKAKLFGQQRGPYKYTQKSAWSRFFSSNDQAILSKCNPQQVKAARRSHFMQLVNATKQSSNCAALYTSLEGCDTPYVFPLIGSDQLFKQFRNAAVQVFRWEEMAQTGCSIAEKYRSSLLQIPLHQGLTQAQLDKLVEIIEGWH